MKIWKRQKVDPICMAPGDSITVKADGKTLLTDTVTRHITADEVVTFDVTDELGLEDGIGAAIGKAAPLRERLRRRLRP